MDNNARFDITKFLCGDSCFYKKELTGLINEIKVVVKPWLCLRQRI